jgi:hypothetical protein
MNMAAMRTFSLAFGFTAIATRDMTLSFQTAISIVLYNNIAMSSSAGSSSTYRAV